MKREISSRVVDRQQPALELEDRGPGVVKRPVAVEIDAEPREVGHAQASASCGEGRRVERWRERTAARADTHQSQCVDPVPGEDLRPSSLGEAGIS